MMLYSYTHMATVGAKQLNTLYIQRYSYSTFEQSVMPQISTESWLNMSFQYKTACI